MSNRSLFNVILKILGIFFIKDILATLPQLLSIIILVTKPNSAENAVTTLSLTLFILLIYVFVSYCLIFKSNIIIDRFKLDKGFDQEVISLTVHRSTILSISIIIIGGLILVQEIPNLCRLLYVYLEERKLNFEQQNPGITYVILACTKIVIGLVLIGNARLLVNFIELKCKK